MPSYRPAFFRLLTALLFLPLIAQAVNLHTEDFETDGNGTRYTVSVEFGPGDPNASSNDYFERTDGSDINAFPAYSGPNNSWFWAAEDTDDNGGNGNKEQWLMISGINIAGYSNLQFQGLFAAPRTNKYDRPDHMQVEARIDGGTWTKILCFSYFNNNGDNFNEPLGFDADCNDEADGTQLTNVFQDFSAAIAGTGTTLDVRVLVHADAASEEMAFDFLRINGDLAGTLAVTATTPADGATNVPVNSSVQITVDSPANWTTNAVTIECPTGSAIAFGGLPASNTASVTLTPTAALPAGTVCTVTVKQNEVTDASNAAVTLAADYVFSFTTEIPFACGAPAIPINQIQGTGAASPLVGNTVDVEAYVVGDFQDNASLNGFYLQEGTATEDGNPLSSEGLFVFEGGNTVNVNPFDRVRIRGEVSEFNGLTEMNISQIAVCGSGSASDITPAQLTLPLNGFDPETVEGMRVVLTHPATVTDTTDILRFGQFVVSNGPLYTPTAIVAPGPAAIAQQALNDDNRFIVDDARNGSYRTPFVVGRDDSTPLNAANPVRTGYVISTLEGVMHYSFGDYKIEPTAPLVWDETANPRSAAPASPGGDIQVASMNVLNFFSTIDTGAPVCGPAGNAGCRGADSASEQSRQLNKLVQAINTIDSDIMGLVEIENNASASLDMLVNALNADAGAGTWDYINTGTIGSDVIKVALIYQPAKVTPEGNFVILDSSVDPLFNDQRNRPVLAQTFRNAANQKMTVAVAHLKSKGGTGTGADADQGDGQGAFNDTRTKAATALANWLNNDPTGAGPAVGAVIIGDLNAYAMEDPLTALAAGGFTDTVAQEIGAGSAWSYRYAGQRGYLDYILADSRALPQLTTVSEWHNNADELPFFDYNEENLPNGGPPKPADFYAPDPYRASDHDPLVAGFSPEAIPTVAFATASSQMLENAGSLDVLLTLSNAFSQAVTVNIVSSDLTATAGSDYTAINQTVTIPANTTSLAVTLTVQDDALLEGNEDLLLTLSNPVNADLGPVVEHTVTIIDDESPVTSYTAPAPTGSGNVTVAISGGGPLCGFTAVQFIDAASLPDLPPGRFEFPYGLVDFVAGQCDGGSSLTVTITYPAEVPSSRAFFKYDGSWSQYPAAVNGPVVTYTITDGGAGDLDGTADGVFTDPAGLGHAPVPVIPVSRPWALLLLALALVGLAWRRRHVFGQ
jgi:predicted extracellular nuclease